MCVCINFQSRISKYMFTMYVDADVLCIYCSDEQYRIMWNELETLVKTHVGTSERHQRVLDCISACRSKPPEEEERKKRGRKREDKEDKTEKNGKDTEEKGWTTDSERLVLINKILAFTLSSVKPQLLVD